MIIEMCTFEGISLVSGWFGLKLAGINRRLKRIDMSAKPLPIIDSYLRDKIGMTTKEERLLTKWSIKLISVVTQYKAFEYLLTLGIREGRKQHENQLEENQRSRNSTINPRWHNRIRCLLVGHSWKAAIGRRD